MITGENTDNFERSKEVKKPRGKVPRGQNPPLKTDLERSQEVKRNPPPRNDHLYRIKVWFACYTDLIIIYSEDLQSDNGGGPGGPSTKP